MDTLFDLNWLAGIIGAVLAYLLGWLWYSPKMFGTLYAKLLNIDIDNCDKTPVLALVITLLYWLVLSALLMLFATFSGFWLLVSLLILVSVLGQLSDVLWGQKDLRIWQINASYDTLGMLLIALFVRLL